MILKVYSVFDSKMEAYMQPFFMQARGQAIRAFVDTATDDSTTIGKHPSDYTLFEIGSFDDQTCKFDLSVTPVSLGVALEFLKQDND